MKIKIDERKDNPFLERKELKGVIDHPEEATPSSESVKEFLSEELGTAEEDIEIDKIFTIRGTQKSRFWAKEFGKVSGKKEEKKETKKEEPEEESDKKEYEEMLNGTIGDGKKAIEDMDNPDLELLLEIEKENKDRKGMKEFIEKKMGD